MLRSFVRALVPQAVRTRLRDARRALILRRAYEQFRSDPFAAAHDPALLARLVYGWDNTAWSAQPGYLRRTIKCLAERPGISVLECGSGLSTLILGTVAERTGARVYSLEHLPEWRDHVSAALDRHGIECATVFHAPITDFGPFEWYAPCPAVRSRQFGLVVCDGPPGTTRGGRYGLLPVMHESLIDDCVVLLDDAQRAMERGVLARWTTEYGGAVQIHSTGQQFGEYRLAGMHRRSLDRLASDR